jgi:polysaccharide export outer membrane protein
MTLFGLPLIVRPAHWLGILAGSLWLMLFSVGAMAAPETPSVASTTREYLLLPNDVIHVSVFQSTDLTLDVVVDERGNIAYPLVGSVHVGGGSLGDAEKAIAQGLRDGGFLVSPQVRVSLVQVKGSLVTVLGHVTHPGRYPLDSPTLLVSDLIAQAGGVAADGGDILVLTGTRDGQLIRREINIRAIGQARADAENVAVRPGDLLFVDRAPMYFIYGEVQRPGTYRLENDLTVMQALATSGGLSPKGTQRGLTIHRKLPDGKVEIFEPKLDDTIRINDVIYVKESLF